jgi:Lrp/AsnC family transcriptional regulator, regulator for asnA, asnC and gidA
MTYALDRLDRQIVEYLQRDGRMPATTIAAELGISERTVRFRIERLVSSGLIGIAAWIDTPKFGLPLSGTVTVTVAAHLAKSRAEYLVSLPEVTYVAMAEPLGNIVLSVVGESGPAIRRFVDREIRTLEGVIETHIFIETTVLKDLASWYPPLDDA